MDTFLTRSELLAGCAARGAAWSESQLQRLVHAGVVPYASRVGRGRFGVLGLFPPEAVDRAVLVYALREEYSYPDMALWLFGQGYRIDSGALRQTLRRALERAAAAVDGLRTENGAVDPAAVDELLRPVWSAVDPEPRRPGRPTRAARERSLQRMKDLAFLHDGLTLMANPAALPGGLRLTSGISLSPRYWLGVVDRAADRDFDAVRLLLKRLRRSVATIDPGGPALAELIGRPLFLKWTVPASLHRGVRGVLRHVVRTLAIKSQVVSHV